MDGGGEGGHNLLVGLVDGAWRCDVVLDAHMGGSLAGGAKANGRSVPAAVACGIGAVCPWA